MCIKSHWDLFLCAHLLQNASRLVLKRMGPLHTVLKINFFCKSVFVYFINYYYYYYCDSTPSFYRTPLIILMLTEEKNFLEKQLKITRWIILSFTFSCISEPHMVLWIIFFFFSFSFAHSSSPQSAFLRHVFPVF